MWAVKLRNWAGAWLLAFLAVAPLWAQEPSPPPVGRPVPVALPGVADPTSPPVLPSPPPIAVPIDAPTPPPPADCTVGPPAPDHWLLSGLYVDGEYLLLRPNRNNLNYAVSSPNTTEIPGGNVNSLDYDTRSAFSFGFGYDLSTGWSVGVHYTYLHSTDEATVNAPAGGAVYATMTRAGTFDQVATAGAAASLNYNVIDLEASKHTVMSDTFDLNVSGGVRVAWIDQTFGAIYNGGPSGAVNATVDTPTYFYGAGLTAGAEGEWKLYRGFGIYAQARGSLLSGQFRDLFQESNNGGATPIVDVQDKFRQFVPVLELGAGVSFETEHIHLRLGYDMANWFDLANTIDFPSPADVGHLQRQSGDLFLEGFSAQLAVLF
jgi:Legionella pneumophila major outer membrane protein precursor